MYYYPQGLILKDIAGLKLIREIRTSVLQNNLHIRDLNINLDWEYLVRVFTKKVGGNSRNWILMFVNNDNNQGHYVSFNYRVGQSDSRRNNSSRILYVRRNYNHFFDVNISKIEDNIIINGSGRISLSTRRDEYQIFGLTYKQSVSNLTDITFTFADSGRFNSGTLIYIYKRLKV